VETLHHNEIEMPAPKGWEDGTRVVLVSTAQEGFRPNIVVSHDPATSDRDAAEFAARHLAALGRALSGYRVLRQHPARLGSHDGYLRVHELFAEQQLLRQMQFYVLLHGQAYTFTFTHLAEHFDELLPTAREIIGATRIAAPAPAQLADDFLG
jgi:hypothetical protein